MSLNGYLIIFILSAIFIGLTAVFAFFGFRTTTIRSNMLKGTKIYKLDLYSRKVHLIEQSSLQKDLFKLPKLKDGNVPLKMIVDIFNPRIQKMFRNAIEEISKDGNRNTFEFDYDLESNNQLFKKHKTFKFVVNLNSIEGSSDYLLSMKWEPVYKAENLELKYSQLTKEQVINLEASHKGFVAFNMNADLDNSDIKLIDTLSLITKKEIMFFKNRNILIVLFVGNSTQNVNSKIHKFISKIKKKGTLYGIRALYKGTGYITIKNMNTTKDLSNAVRALDFLITVSIATNQPFFSNQKDGFDPDEYKVYTKASKLFLTNVKAGKVDTKYIPIRSYASNRKVMDYAYPTINGINDNMLTYLLTNHNNNIKLMNSHAHNVGVEKSIDSPVLIDVNANWLVKYGKLLNYKKAIYAVNITKDVLYEDLKQIMVDLNNEGIIFAIRVKRYNEFITMLIKQTKPKFLIVDKMIWGKTTLSTSNTFINLLTLKKLADSENIKIIYEDPHMSVDKETAEKIGMKYLYKY